MTLARNVLTARGTAVKNALSRADANRDGRLSATEQRRATSLVKGAADDALREAFKQARLSSGFVSVGKARSRVNLAMSRATAVDTNRNGISASERARLTGPIARALTQGATGGAPVRETGGTTSTSFGPFGPKARRLAESARRMAQSMNTRGWCARGVNRAMAAAGLGTSPLPSAYMYAKRLEGDSRFREIKNVSDAQLRRLPPGAIVVYDASGGRTRHGHIMVTIGNGLEASDHIARVSTHGRQRVFVPRG
jgi:hypothetical protein